MSTAVLLLDEQLQLSHINAAAEDLLSLSASRHLNQTFTDLLPDAEEMQRILSDTLSSSQPHTQREALLKIQRGSELVKTTVDYTVTPIFDIPGSVLVVEIQPIDRLLRINRDASLFSAQESSNALLKGLAHEVKNPLGGLRGAAQLLEQELETPELKEYTRIIIDEADRLRNLVDRMLGPAPPKVFAPVNIHEVIERVRQLIVAECGDEITISRDYDPSIPDILGDEGGLIQAILNITRNAVQALKETGHDHLYKTEGRRIKIVTRILRHFTIGRQHHKLICSIEITDNGPGIPEDIRQQIFVPMVSGHAENTGLGLAISQSIINQHHGLIGCNSEAGETCFSIYLPLESP
jgi:two-component system nitrogen regulation sensor histidine kinase GlnL